jgi:two-component system, NtrC family, sensor kinase
MRQRILYVDDDRANVVVFRAAFAGDLDVITADSAAEARVLLDRHRDVALLLTDQRMPGMSGAELAEIVRREHPDVVRYLITAYSDLDAAIDAINRGQVHRYLRKPWEAQEMRVHLREGLAMHALTRRLRDLEHRLREVERVYALGVVAASVVHELRNPLSVVFGHVDLLRHLGEQVGELPDPGAGALAGELAHILEGTGEAARRMGEIVRGVELSTRRRIGVPRADLGEVTELTIKLVLNELRHRTVTAIDVARDLPVGVAPGPLGQVALNLIINALQALPAERAPETCHLRITTCAVGDQIRLEVADNGPGVPPELRERIFDPFFTTKADGGTGLGLAISRQIVEEAGGTLTVAETAGGGATFIVELPRA